MQAVRSINNNIAVCIDSTGAELIAMGKGIGYGKMPHEVSLDDITHTYYNVEEHKLAGISEIPQDVLDFAAKMNDLVRGQLDYQLSPNFVFTLADHIAFAIKRAESNLQVRMPLAFDVEQNYPIEYRIGRQMVRRIRREFSVALRDDEAGLRPQAEELAVVIPVLCKQTRIHADHGRKPRARAGSAEKNELRIASVLPDVLQNPDHGKNGILQGIQSGVVSVGETVADSDRGIVAVRNPQRNVRAVALQVSI